MGSPHPAPSHHRPTRGKQKHQKGRRLISRDKRGPKKQGRSEVSDAKRLKALEDENAKLKKLLAEQMLDLAAMKELVSKKW